MNNIIKIDDFFYCDLPDNIAFEVIYNYNDSYIAFYTDNINLLKYKICRVERRYGKYDNFTKCENYYTFEYVDNIDFVISPDLLVKNREGYSTYKNDVNSCLFYYMFELTTLSDIAKFKMLVD